MNSIGGVVGSLASEKNGKEGSDLVIRSPHPSDNFNSVHYN